MLTIARMVFAVVLIATGLLMIIFGDPWGSVAFNLLPDSEVEEWLSLFIPFLPIFLIGVGATILVRR
jgi:hypothetical protein